MVTTKKFFLLQEKVFPKPSVGRGLLAYLSIYFQVTKYLTNGWSCEVQRGFIRNSID